MTRTFSLPRSGRSGSLFLSSATSPFALRQGRGHRGQLRFVTMEDESCQHGPQPEGAQSSGGHNHGSWSNQGAAALEVWDSILQRSSSIWPYNNQIKGARRLPSCAGSWMKKEALIGVEGFQFGKIAGKSERHR